MIQIEQLAFDYGHQRIYDDFSLELHDSGVYGLFGRNGSGKSTLLKIIAGLLFPKSGTVKVDSYIPSHRHPDFLAQVYIVPEDFHLPNISLAKLAKTQSFFYPNFSHRDFDDYAKLFAIPTDKNFESMSLGKRKKRLWLLRSQPIRRFY